MSELQMALIAAGALLVLAVWGFNVWQEKKHRQRAERMLPASGSDVLMAGRPATELPETPAAFRRQEPGVAAAPAVPREPTFGDAPATPPSPAPEVQSPAAAPAPAVAVPAEWGDGRADCLLRIEFVEPVAVTALWAEHAGWSQRLDKPLRWLGLSAQERWRTLAPQDPGTVTQLAVALQLVNRQGAVGEATLTTFLQGAHQLAQAFAGLIELPEPAAVLARAGELDGFCAGVDVQLALYVLPRQGSLALLPGDKLVALCEQEGLKLEGERCVAFDAAGAEAFALSWQAAAATPATALAGAALTSLTLSLDVPRTAGGAIAFDRMVACARKCAETLGGKIVDAQQKPLAEATLGAIRARIEELQGLMAAREIPAGSVRALRLFS